MNVPNIGQGVNSIAVLSRPPRNDVVVALREGSGSGAREHQVRERPVATDSNASFTRIGWFDVNGDGSIDGRSPMAGGDGTLLLPHVVKVATHSRPARATASNDAPVCADQLDGKAEAEPGSEAETDGAAPPAPKADAQTRQAIAAYERYGQPATSTPTSSSSERAA
jgi:hypothetical protein